MGLPVIVDVLSQGLGILLKQQFGSLKSQMVDALPMNAAFLMKNNLTKVALIMHWSLLFCFYMGLDSGEYM